MECGHGFELQRIKILAEADKNLSSAGSSIRASESSEGHLWIDERPLLLSAIKFFEDAQRGYNSFCEFMKTHEKIHLTVDETGVFIRDRDIKQISSRIYSETEKARNRLACPAQADTPVRNKTFVFCVCTSAISICLQKSSICCQS